MREAFHAHSEPQCTSCHSHTTNTNFNHNYDAYIKGDCLSEHTVWSFLMEENSNHYFGQSREQLVEQMAALYPDGTDNKCICSKKFDLNYPYLPSEDVQWARTCRHSDSHYHTSFANAITHLFGHYSHHHSTQTCHSHAAVWQELNRILKHDHHPVHCLETLIRILQKAVHEHGDPCICNPVASTTRTTDTSTMINQHTPTQLTTTQPTKTTSHPTASTAQSNPTAIQQTATTSRQTKTTTHPTASTAQSNTITIQQTTTTSRQTIAQSPSTTEKKTTTAQPTTKTTQKFASITNPTTTTAQPAAMTSQPATAAATQPTFNWVTLKNTSSSTVAVAHTTECSKILIIEELAKYQQMYPEFNTDCSNQISASNLIVRKLCPSVPVTQIWKPGFKVTESCDILKSYIPVATFTPSSEYPPDGLAGVFLGCTDSSIKIATQECGERFSILELLRQPAQSESFTHTASNYHVVMF